MGTCESRLESKQVGAGQQETLAASMIGISFGVRGASEAGPKCLYVSMNSGARVCYIDSKDFAALDYGFSRARRPFQRARHGPVHGTDCSHGSQRGAQSRCQEETNGRSPADEVS